MASPQFPFFSLGILFSFCRAEEYAVTVKSVQSVEIQDSTRLGDPPTGCKMWGTKVEYHCDKSSEATDLSVIPQLLTMRADCRGTHGRFQNLTLEERRFCGRLTYRMYGNGSTNPTKPWLPLVHPYILTMEPEDVVDIQCVLLPFHMGLEEDHPKFVGKDGRMSQYWDADMGLILDGAMSEARHMRKILPYGFELRYPPKASRSCESAVADGYKWKWTVQESTDNSHLVRFASPNLTIPAIFSPLDDDFKTGEIFHVNKDLLHISVLDVLSVPDKQQLDPKLVTIDENFYREHVVDGFAVEVKLDVDSDALPRDTYCVQVKMGFRFRSGHDSKGFFWIQLLVEMEQSGSVVPILLMVFLVCLMMGAPLCYAHQEDLFSLIRTIRTFRFRRTDEHHSIEMQGQRDRAQ